MGYPGLFGVLEVTIHQVIETDFALCDLGFFQDMGDHLVFKHHSFNSRTSLLVLPIIVTYLIGLLVSDRHFFDGMHPGGVVMAQMLIALSELSPSGSRLGSLELAALRARVAAARSPLELD